MRQRKCRACDAWHDMGAPWPAECMGHWPKPAAPSQLPRPYVIKDTLPGGVNGMRSMADNRMYDSRSEYLRSLRGKYEVVGNDALPPPKTVEPEGVGEAIKQAGEQLGVW